MTTTFTPLQLTSRSFSKAQKPETQYTTLLKREKERKKILIYPSKLNLFNQWSIFSYNGHNKPTSSRANPHTTPVTVSRLVHDIPHDNVMTDPLGNVPSDLIWPDFEIEIDIDVGSG